MAEEADAEHKWHRMFAKWSNKFPMDATMPEMGTWLDSRWRKGLGVGCKACHAAGLTSPLATYQVKAGTSLQPAAFAKHAACQAHALALKAFLAPDVAGADSVLHCPTVEVYEAVADLVQRGADVGTVKNETYALAHHRG